MNNSANGPAFNILLQSVRVDDTVHAVKTAEDIISGNDISWDDLYYLAELHSIRPQLAKLINRVDPSLVPEEFRQKLNLAHQEILYPADEFCLRIYSSGEGA